MDTVLILLCLRRVILRFRLFVGGPQGFRRLRQKIGYIQCFSLCHRKVNRWRISMVRKGRRDTPHPNQPKSQIGSDKQLHCVILAARSSKRNGPLVPAHAGGNAR